MLISEPKFNWVIAKASSEDMQEIRKWIERLDKTEPTVVADDSLDKMENRNQVVQRFIKLEHSSPDRMSSILSPLLGPAGRMLPESNTNTLMIVDTVENLLRIEKVVAQFDVPPREDIVTQVFELQHREPEEITTLLSSILGEGVGSSMNSFGREGYRGPSCATRIIRVDRARFKSSRPSSGPAATSPWSSSRSRAASGSSSRRNRRTWSRSPPGSRNWTSRCPRSPRGTRSTRSRTKRRSCSGSSSWSTATRIA